MEKHQSRLALDQLLHMVRPQLEEQRIQPVDWEAGDADGLWWVNTYSSCLASPSLYSCGKWIISS